MEAKQFGLNDIVEMKKNNIHVAQMSGKLFVWVRMYALNVKGVSTV